MRVRVFYLLLSCGPLPSLGQLFHMDAQISSQMNTWCGSTLWRYLVFSQCSPLFSSVLPCEFRPPWPLGTPYSVILTKGDCWALVGFPFPELQPKSLHAVSLGSHKTYSPLSCSVSETVISCIFSTSFFGC